MSLGARIREKRKAKGLTLQQLGDVFGITRSSVSEWENGKTRPDQAKLVRLAEALGTTMEYLLEESGHNVPVIIESKSINTPKIATQKMADGDQPAGKLPAISWSETGNWGKTMNALDLRDDVEMVPCPFVGDFVLRVIGDSMFNPGGDVSLRDGEYISVHAGVQPTHRNLVVVLRRGDTVASLKQILIEGDGTAMLHVLNPAWPNRYVPLDPESTIVGVVTGQWRAL